jgi:MFS family permease
MAFSTQGKATGGYGMITAYVGKLRLLSRDVRLVLITYASAGFCYFGIISVLLNLYLLRLGYGPEFIGLFNGIPWLAYAISCVPAGALGIRWGSRRTMIAGIGLTVVGTGLLPLAESLPPGTQDWWLLVTNTLAYLGSAVWTVSGIPFLAGATSPEERGHAFSVLAALIPLGGFAGNLVGGFLPGVIARPLGASLNMAAPYRYPLWLAAAGYGLIALPALLAAREPRPRSSQDAVVGASGAPYSLIASLALTRLLWAAGAWAAIVFFNVYLDTAMGAPTSLIGTLSAIGSLTTVLAGLATAVLLGRLGKGRTLLWGAFGLVLGLLPLALLPHWLAAGIGLVVTSAAESIAGAAFTVYSQEIVPPRWRAAMSGAGLMAWGLSSSMVSLGGGYIIASSGYRRLFLAGAGIALVGAMLFWASFLRKPRGEFARASVTGEADDGR